MNQSKEKEVEEEEMNVYNGEGVNCVGQGRMGEGIGYIGGNEIKSKESSRAVMEVLQERCWSERCVKGRGNERREEKESK